MTFLEAYHGSQSKISAYNPLAYNPFGQACICCASKSHMNSKKAKDAAKLKSQQTKAERAAAAAMEVDSDCIRSSALCY